MLQLNHKDCGGVIYINVDIRNIFGKPNIKIKDKNKILISFASLIAFNVQINSAGLRCDSCNKILEDNTELVLTCGHTGNRGMTEDFRIIYAAKENGEELRPQLLHISAIENYIKDVKKDGFVVQEVQPEIFLDKGIKNA